MSGQRDAWRLGKGQHHHPEMANRMVQAVDEGDYMRALMLAGRDRGPYLLWDWFEGDRLSREELRGLILEVWQNAEWPVPTIGERAWLAMFGVTGFVSDTDIPPPTTELTVWRGAGRPRRMSWTLDREQAAWFAKRSTDCGVPATVYEATVPPRAVLGLILDPESRQEHEVIVNPNMLRGRVRP